MILAIDIGNTTVALAGLEDGRVCFVTRADTIRDATEEICRRWMEKALSECGRRLFRFEGAILSSVVPEVTDMMAKCAEDYCGKPPLIISPNIKTGLTMAVPNPEKVGKDRIVDAAACAAYYPLPAVTVDMGTATTFNVIDEEKRFLGGLICSGLSTGLQALTDRCAQLPPVHLAEPKSAIGRNTIECMVSGAVLGGAALVDGLVSRIEEQMGRPVTVVLTGGLSRFVRPYCQRDMIYEPDLLFKGMAALYKANQK